VTSAREFGIVYESRAGLIALLRRLGLEYHKPEVIGRSLDVEKQQAFIANYEKLQNALGPDEAVLFVDAVHPTHAGRPVGCWAPKEDHLAIEQTSGRQRINIHGAVNLETGQTSMTADRLQPGRGELSAWLALSLPRRMARERRFRLARLSWLRRTFSSGHLLCLPNDGPAGRIVASPEPSPMNPLQ
jgi:hypothetical protein